MSVLLLRRIVVLGLLLGLGALPAFWIAETGLSAVERARFAMARYSITQGFVERAEAAATRADDAMRAPGARPIEANSLQAAGESLSSRIQSLMPAGFGEVRWDPAGEAWIEVHVTGQGSESEVRSFLFALSDRLPDIAVTRLEIAPAGTNLEWAWRLELVLQQSWMEQGE